MHLVQALILSPDGKVSHWRFGYFLFMAVGLYLPRSLTNLIVLIDFLSQIAQVLDIGLYKN
jgi:hypothetical protein